MKAGTYVRVEKLEGLPDALWASVALAAWLIHKINRVVLTRRVSIKTNAAPDHVRGAAPSTPL